MESRAEPSEKRAARIASAIEQEIVESRWPAGLVIGSEADLVQRFATSRTVLREAVRLLEQHGVATTRRGPGGGLVVTQPDASAVADAAIALLEYSNVTVVDLVEILYLLEPMAASLAAGQLSEDGIRQLREHAVSARSGGSMWSRHTQMHSLLAEMAGNPVLRLFIDVCSTLLTWFATRTMAAEGPWAAEMAKTEPDVVHAQERLAETVALGDPVAAGQIATRHLQAMLTWVTATEVRLSRVRRGRRDVSAQRDRVSETKVAPALAGHIRSDVVALGWPLGENLGSESELLERYQVSRTILRQAVRILEYEQVAVMRRGPSGGLIVTEPSIRSVTVAAALFLGRQDVREEDLLPVRTRLELGCLDILLSHDAVDLAAELRSLQETGGSTAAGTLSGFHTGLARLTGNPALTLFQQVIGALADVVPQSGPDGCAGPEVIARMREEHARIAEAIVGRDIAIARQRMLRHLESSACGRAEAGPATGISR
jgi:DNA-binding FadR family transcriptional regulator